MKIVREKEGFYLSNNEVFVCSINNINLVFEFIVDLNSKCVNTQEVHYPIFLTTSEYQEIRRSGY